MCVIFYINVGARPTVLGRTTLIVYFLLENYGNLDAMRTYACSLKPGARVIFAGK